MITEMQRKMGGAIVEIVAPALIMIMTGSLAFFLIELFYYGSYTGRVKWVIGLFVFATVLVSRLSIMESAGKAIGYGFILACATILVLALIGNVNPLLGVLLAAVVIYVNNKLTWDCTVIDNTKDSTDRGLLERIGLDSDAEPASDEDEEDTNRENDGQERSENGSEAASWTTRFFNKKKPPNTPGVWVIYLALAAFPIYGLGQGFITEELRRQNAFFDFCLYLIGALGLLVTTAMLGLQRYLIRRKASMPNNVAITWVATGVAMIAAILIAAWILPRPYAEYAYAENPFKFEKESWWGSSKNPVGSEGKKEGGSGGNKNEKSESRGGNSKQKGNSSKKSSQRSKADSNSKNGSQSSGKSGKQSGGKKSQGSKSQGSKSQSDSSKSKSSGSKSSNGKSRNSKSESQQSKSGSQNSSQNSKSESQKSGDQNQSNENQKSKGSENSKQDSKSNESKRNRSKQQNSSGRNSGSKSSSGGKSSGNNSKSEKSNGSNSNSSPSKSSTSTSMSMPPVSGILWIVQVLFWIVIAIAILYFAWRYRKELYRSWLQFLDDLRNFWDSLFGRKKRKKKQGLGGVTEATAPTKPTVPFSAFSNPFSGGQASAMSHAQLIKYTFEALEAWGRERGVPREEDSTPHEFAMALAELDKSIARQAKILADNYCAVAFSSQPSVDPAIAQHLSNLWNSLNRQAPATPLQPA